MGDEDRTKQIIEQHGDVLKALADPDNPEYLRAELEHAVEAAIMFQESAEKAKARVKELEAERDAMGLVVEQAVAYMDDFCTRQALFRVIRAYLDREPEGGK